MYEGLLEPVNSDQGVLFASDTAYDPAEHHINRLGEQGGSKEDE
jgi:hypothetical protein